MPPNKKQKTSDKQHNSGSSLGSPLSSNNHSKDDWRAKCKNVLEVNRFALKNATLTDVTFLVGPEERAFEAHKLFLALGSPVFEAMFYGPLAEKGNVIMIPDICPEGFHNLLRSLYTNDPDIQIPEVAFETYVAADKYCITHLKEECEQYLCASKLSPSNVWIILDKAIFWNCTSIVAHCLNFVKNNIKISLNHSSFLEVTDKCLESVLQLENLNVSETILLHNIVLWADHKSDTDPKQSFQEIISPLLKFIRFGALTPSEFSLFLEMTKSKNVLKSDDALMILKHLVLPLTCSLPDWCCMKTWRDNHKDVFLNSDDSVNSETVKKLDALDNLLRYNKAMSSSSSSTSSFSSSSSSSSSTSSSLQSSDSDDF